MTEATDPAGDLDGLRAKGYYLLPIPPREKEPPPKGWVEATAPYEIPAGWNVAIGTRGEVMILITNSEPATEWATREFGEPNVHSRRGGHWYFAGGDGWANLPNAETAVGTMELHVDRKYALVPPSVHPSGLLYTWGRELPPVPGLPPCPIKIRDLWRPRDPEPTKTAVDSAGVQDAIARAVAPHWRPGVRWKLTKAVAGLARKYLQLDQADARALVQRIADAAGDRDPLDREGKIPYTYKLELARVAVGYWFNEAGAPDLDDRVFGLLRGRGLPTADEQEPGTRPHPDCWFREDPKDPDSEEKPSSPGFVAALENEFTFATIPASREANEDVLCYVDGFYQSAAPTVRNWIEREFRSKGKVSSAQFRSHVLGAIAAAHHVRREEFDPLELTNLANCVLEPATGRVRPHGPLPRFRYKLAVAYDPAAKCPGFLRFLARTLPGQDDRDLIQEEFGYTFKLGNPLKKGFYWYGDTDTSKSTLSAILKGLLGARNTACIPLQAFDRDKFASSGLEARFANIFPDLPGQSIRAIGVLKMLLGNVDEIQAEKKYEAAHHFVNTCKMFFSSNVFPDVQATDEDAEAYFRRWLVTEFTVRIPIEEQDPGLADRLVREEGPGILNWALEGLHRLLERGRFPTSATVESVTELWRNRSDSLRWYTREGGLIRNGWVPKPRFMAAYSEFCGEHNTTALDPQKVGLRLPKLIPGLRPDRRTVGKRRENVWVGVSLPPPSEKRLGRGGGGRGGPPRALSREEKEELVKKGSTTPATPTTPGTGEAAGRPVTERKRHPNCPLCPKLDSHLCIACEPCRWYEAHGQEANRS